ncbi:MAG: nucleotidyltransferase domain-containing protein [Ardenticatenales bacterium]|jgi:type I restriction enzyme S subunit|nr:nucleotidyltransferase domain-containing protein [Ardenticatenales bacterium]
MPDIQVTQRQATTLDVAPAHLALLRAILARHIPDRTVVAFGSRTIGAAKPWSDLDLAILGNTRLPVVVLARLASDLTESMLPFRVDIVERAAVSGEFGERIDRGASVVRSGASA